MAATVYEIVNKKREVMFGAADIADFDLHESGQIPAEEIVSNPHISLYALDFDNGRAVFVETKADADLGQAPFYFISQFENALRVLTISFATMIQLARAISVDDRKLIFIHSTGRAGSTLASKIFAQVDGVINMSEPDVLTLLVAARSSEPENKAGLRLLLDAAVRLLCKEQAGTAWVIKGRSFVIELVDWLAELYPRAAHLFLYRDAETYLESGMRALVGDTGLTEEEQMAMANAYRQFLSPLAPLLAQVDPERFLSGAGILTVLWLSVMERAVRLQEAGVEMLPICYENWVSTPRETAVAVLDYAGCRPADLSAVYETLTKDSQAGSAISQDITRAVAVAATAADREEMRRLLQEHPFINTAGYELPNTYKP